jgi:hypothetical protein
LKERLPKSRPALLCTNDAAPRTFPEVLAHFDKVKHHAKYSCPAQYQSPIQVVGERFQVDCDPALLRPEASQVHVHGRCCRSGKQTYAVRIEKGSLNTDYTKFAPLPGGLPASIMVRQVASKSSGWGFNSWCDPSLN